MNTIMIFLNAVSTNDSCALKTILIGINWSNVLLLIIICGTIYAIISVLSNGYFNWKKEERETKNNTAKDLNKHENDLLTAKHKVDMETKIINYLETLAKKELTDRKEAEAFKAAHKEYISRLEQYLEINTKKNTEENHEENPKEKKGLAHQCCNFFHHVFHQSTSKHP